MYGMFWSCTGLTSLDISGFTFKNDVDLGSMFNGCSKLETVTFPKTAGDSQIKSMSSMFNGCSSLKSLDLSRLDTSSAKYMYRMFYGCNSLTDLKLGGAFSTAGASGMTEMFYECASLTALDLSTFDTSSVTEPSSSPSSSDGSLQPLEGSGSTTGMTNMFSGCNRLATLVLGAKFKFVGSATLISPNSSYINGATGNWKSKVDGKIYTAAQIASDRGGIADTYTAETSGTNTDISAATISPIPSQVYSGSSLTPVFTVRLGDKTLNQGTDYTVSYQNAAGFTSHSLVSAGTYIVYVVGVNTVDKGGYWGTKTASFTITPCNIDAATLSSSTTTYTYTGSNQTPTFDCTLDGKTISTYMTYTYKDANGNEVIPREVGTYTATATANGNYQGTTKPLSFTIEKANIGEYNSSTISGVAPSYAHTGQTVKPVPAVIYKDSKLTPDTDYTIEIRKDSPTAGEVVTAPTDDGTYYLCITGKGSYQGTIYVSYKIEDTMTTTDINFATVSCAGDFYSGDALTPSCAVTLGATGSGETARHLVEGTDYTVTLEDNQGKEVKPCIDAGDYTLVITGKGAYAGVTKKDKLFTVNPEPIYYCTWVAVSDQTYTGKPITPSIDLTFNNRALVKDTDYTLTFADSAGNTIATPTDVGTYRAVITGKGNYVSMSYRSFNIVSKCTSFTDVKSDVATNGFDNVWYVHDGWLDFVVSNGLMSGYTDGSGNFGTYDSITRGQVATILYRYECGKDSTLEATYGSTYNTGGKKYATDTVFADEASGAYYTAAINWAKAVGIMTGDSSTGYTTVRPDDPVQRQELCLMLARFAQKVEHASAAEGSVDYSGVKGMDAVDSWAIAGVKWCASYGVVGGVNVGGTYYMNPTDPSWRASMAKMITVTVRDVL